jgi:hypothetical protein
LQEYKAKMKDIAVVYSADTHYSIPKALGFIAFKRD